MKPTRFHNLIAKVLPFNAHNCQVENGGDSRDVLHVIDELAEKFTKSPRESKELSQLQYGMKN